VADFEQRKRFKRIVFSKAMGAVLLILLVFLGKITWNIYRKERDSRERVVQLEKEAADLRNRKDDLAADLERLKSDRGLEEEIRTKFPVAKEGERVIQIVEPRGEATSSEPVRRGLWERIVDAFRN
jgi:cell division protein FtsB